MANNYRKNWVKFIAGWVVCFAIRLFPFRPPNIEPIMATTMPFSKRYGYIAGFVFSFLSIALFDLAVGKVGEWTWITACAYGLIALGAALYFKNRQATAGNFLVYSVIGTIVYDALTGLIIGPLLFGQSFTEAFLGQIPFTASHLLGNSILALLVSPAIYHWIVMNPKFETKFIFSKIRLSFAKK